jgi:hypothetical protein
MLLTERAAPEHRALLSVGWESTWLARVGYARSLGTITPSAVDFTWSIPVFAGNPLRGGRMDVGFSPLSASTRGLNASVSVRSGVSWSSDPLGRRVSWTGALVLAPGWYGDRWHLAADIGWRAALVTWVKHSSVVRDLYGDRGGLHDPAEGPETGPFALSSQRTHLGLRGGWGKTKGLGFVGRAGLDISPQAQGIVGAAPIFPLPFYVELGGDTRW